ncbi:alpha/beta hydrolase [Luteipulveratus sp. YIM 133132]|uniref:alpha/beta fold hydrolase n=1 Tax=Luteipulveratus flavus TaxID=3031728 RepID=UPI0023B073F6|nr:alpha/beta hydrolase [Luteipulveratus sp. YIM 133132]MDE9367271.1 alpha/beta hydrolase [Luteipulveratus sp. YIM 133132]
MSDFIAVGDSLVHVVEHGPARPQHGTIVLLHGFPCDHRLMTGAFEPVLSAREGWRRLYVDLPGLGRSVAGPSIDSTDAVLAVVQELVATLVPEGPVLLAGESYGGYLTQGLLAADPGRYAGVCLVAPGVIAQRDRRTVPPAEVLVRDPDAVADLTQEERAELDEYAVVQDARVLQRMREEIEVAAAEADDEAVARISARYTGTFEAMPAPSYDRPSLMIAGRQDSVVGYSDQWPMVERFSRITYAVLDRAGHNVHLEQEVLFGALVHEWLDRVEEWLD